MCCSNAAWKREEVPDHKFDFVNIQEFHTNNWATRLQYVWLYILVGKSAAVYVADVYTAIALLASNRWSGSILQSQAAQGNSSAVLEVPFTIGKWVFTGCIIFSFLLLLWETRKARAIIKSRDISYAFTNVLSQDWYSMRSYDHFCFFCQIDNSKKKKDEFAFFIFFTFKGWKRLLLADAPRQVINAITLYSFGKSEGWTTDLSVYFGGGLLKAGVIATMLFTLVIWVGSAILLLIAAVMYVPLLCYIQGNLKEYCCHKVDKRIAELMKRKNRKRFAKEAEFARNEARGDFSHLKDRTGAFTATPLPQPTLPQLGLGDDELYSSYAGSEKQSMRGGGRGGPDSNSQYPPSSVSGSRYAPSGKGGGYGGGYDRPTGPPATLYRNAYPYALSEPDSLNKGGYAESVTSLDNFAGRGAPMGHYEEGPPIHRTTTPGQMSRAPSYYSEDEKLGSTEDYIVDGRSGAVSPPSQLSYARPQSYHQQHSQIERQPSPYGNAAPNRSARNQSEVSLTRMRESQLYSSDDIVGAYGWEEGEGRESAGQGGEYYEQERRNGANDQGTSRMPHYR